MSSASAASLALGAKNDAAGARKAADESLAIARRLAAADPGQVTRQRDLSVALEREGDVAQAAGDAAAAGAAYAENLALRRRLVAAAPSDAMLQRDLAVALWREAGVPNSGVGWADVAGQLAAMDRQGILSASDRASYAEAQRRAAATQGHP